MVKEFIIIAYIIEILIEVKNHGSYIVFLIRCIVLVKELVIYLQKIKLNRVVADEQWQIKLPRITHLHLKNSNKVKVKMKRKASIRNRMTEILKVKFILKN